MCFSSKVLGQLVFSSPPNDKSHGVIYDINKTS
jgi:hypothetical protein